MAAGTSEFLAADAYREWRRRVKAAKKSVRIYSPYLDGLVVSLLGNANLDAARLSVVTDLSPASGARTYRAQLLAMKRLLSVGVEVRSLPRLHAKVLLIDELTATVGSQNFTSYARQSHETTVVPKADLSLSAFVVQMRDWYHQAESVDMALVDRLLDRLDASTAEARAAIEALVAAYEEERVLYATERQEAALRRFRRDLARAQVTSAAAGMRAAAAASSYRTGQSVAYAQLQWDERGEYQTMLAERGVDLTTWYEVIHSGFLLDDVDLKRLAFYPAVVGPNASLAFVRVAKSRITYVWRGVRWSEARVIGGYLLYMRTAFPDDQADGANLVVTFSWAEGARAGFELRLRFDGTCVLPVAEGRRRGTGRAQELLEEIVQSVYEDEEAWQRVLDEIFGPVGTPREFRNHPNAAEFFPPGWFRVTLTKFLDHPVLLFEPYE